MALESATGCGDHKKKCSNRNVAMVASTSR